MKKCNMMRTEKNMIYNKKKKVIIMIFFSIILLCMYLKFSLYDNGPFPADIAAGNGIFLSVKRAVVRTRPEIGILGACRAE